jgi:hypothetical protein|tara:strand:- start:1061 stop:1435 length:375 start_codon:yes stop_codon:yes gene_type:complete
MTLGMIFRISGIILFINGLSMFFTPGMAIEMYGMTIAEDMIVLVRGLGLSFAGTGILVFMLPSWIDSKLAAAGILAGLTQLAWFCHLGYDLYTDNISGTPAIINLLLTAIFAILFFVMSAKHSK